jgi:hypothetical protein
VLVEVGQDRPVAAVERFAGDTQEGILALSPCSDDGPVPSSCRAPTRAISRRGRYLGVQLLARPGLAPDLARERTVSRP